MSELVQQAPSLAVELPSGAPQVRVTAGAGTPGQKTWNLRRPVTLIGSRRPASIVLHDRQTSAAHCVIVNTGSDVLLKDLHTSGGTLCNGKPIDLVLLKDGDVITVGDMTIQVAIQMNCDGADDSASGTAYVDPVRLPSPALVHLANTDTEWRIEDAVVFIGRHADAEIHLDHEAIGPRQAVLFRFGDGQAIFDLNSHTSLTINGAECALGLLGEGDRVAVGPCVLCLGSMDSAFPVVNGLQTAPVSDNDSGKAPGALPTQPSSVDPKETDGTVGGTESPLEAGSPLIGGEGSPDNPKQALGAIETQLGTLQKSIGQSWERLNSWESQVAADPAAAGGDEDPAQDGRAAELDAKDAALRGQLHDLTRHHEQIVAREHDVALQLARIQAAQSDLEVAQAAASEREATLERRAEELRRRERVLAQRWARLQAATCPNCGTRVSVTQANPLS